tara:strand:+ start:5214 stop:5957 length:744 start_codon:yes stop_codon:yes gene_type:complete
VKIEFDQDPALLLQRLAKKFRDDASQATARLAVATGKELAIVTEFRGKGRQSKATTTENLEKSAARVCYTVKGDFMQKLRRAGTRARVKYDTWQAVRPGQLVSDPGAINKHIDKMRDGKANTRKKIPWPDMIICTESAFKRAMTQRRKRVGIHKGGWLGAGVEAARLQVGPDRAKIGKNQMNWAQKHLGMGSARWAENKKQVVMSNQAVAAQKNLARGKEQEAYERAWKNTVNWYKKAIKRREKALS